MIAARAALAGAITAALTGCAAPSPAAKPARAPTTDEWRYGLDRLAALRRRAAVARTVRVALEVFEPRMKRRFQARGAVAIAPPRALRMILLGPGGTTAFDLWIGGDRYRFVVPAIERTARGDLRAPNDERRGLPIDLLRAWLLRVGEGDLLWHARERAADRFLLRDGPAILDVIAHDDGRVDLRRSTRARDGHVEVDAISAERLGCGAVKLHQGSTKLDMIIRCEGEALGDPPPRALVDPDAEDAP